MTKQTNTQAVPVSDMPVRENRYVRTARILVKNRERGYVVGAEKLASMTDMQPSTASFCIEAFDAVLQVLAENGYTVNKVKTLN